MMALGDVAAKLDLPVFPCGDDKRPVIANGFKAATRDHQSIIDAFNRPGASKIGVPTGAASGIVVVDVDIKNGQQGMAWLDENQDALPQTRTHKTQSGGLHLVFLVPEGIEIRNSASKVAPGVDVRGEGGYVIFPPSPGYTMADPIAPAEMPRWLISACLKEPERTPATDAYYQTVEDKYVWSAVDGEARAVATAGEGTRNDRLNIAAVKLGGFIGAGKLSRYTVETILTNSARESGLPEKEIGPTIKSGIEHGIKSPRDIPQPKTNGHSAPQSQQQSQEPGTEEDTPRNPYFQLIWFNEIQPILDVKDFVQGLLMEQSSAVVYGQSNSGKTFWTTDLSLHISAGMRWNGRRIEQSGVIYCALEGSVGFSNRVAAWKKERNLESQDLPFAAISSAINLLDPLADTEKLILTVKAAALRIKVPVRIIIVDTLARAIAGGNENAPDDMGALVKNMDKIREQTGAMVMFIHHSGKDQAKGARGHSSLQAAIDTEIEVAVDEEDGTRTATVVKQREMKKGDVFAFALKVIELGENHHQEPITTCIIDSCDVPEPSPGRPSGLTGRTKQAYEILCDAINKSGKDGFRGTPAGRLSIPESWWRDNFYQRAMPGAKDAAKQKAFRRAADEVLDRGLAVMDGGRIWLPREDDYRSPDKDDMDD